MKLDCVLTACNTNLLYLDFIPIFIKTWNKLYPNVDVKIILISDNIPEQLECYSSNIILFTPIENISTAFISQYIRNLYPAILNYENGIMITDMDILPMNKTYYTKNIEKFDNDKFIYLRNVLLNSKEIAMCYNVATNKTWSDVFNIKNEDDIKDRLIDINDKIIYKDGHGQKGWNTDQLDLYKYIMNWNNKTNNFIFLKDNETGYKRLDRNTFQLNDKLINLIRNGSFSDYHCYRPFKKYEKINNAIYDSLP